MKDQASLDELLDIGEVSERTGLAPSALRFYEQRGLIAHDDRKGLRRQYSPVVIDRLAFIVLGQEAGLTLDELAQLLASRGREWKRIARRKHGEVSARIERLEAVRTRLEHALECSSPTFTQCDHRHHALSHVFPVQPRWST
jgi:MerR family redox-sensitive transcriptional activator SoxR